ncbi:MAG: hypothetical protein JSW58_06280, partial [Candidatus Latescibacterota bacterium]
LYDKLRGITGDLFQFLKGEGSQFKDDAAGALEVRNKDDDGYDQFRIDHIRASNTLFDAINVLNLQGRIADIEFSFDGASAPSPGSNTGSFGFCHTTGGSYTAGQIVYDDGTALLLMPIAVARNLTTRSAISGTISFNANCHYVLQGSSWVLKGIAPDLGVEHIIRMDYDFNDTVLSSTSVIPDGAMVTRVQNKVETAFNSAAPSLLLEVDGTVDVTIFAAADNNQKKEDEYEDREIKEIGASNEGPVRLTLDADSAPAGAGFVIIEYDIPSA